MLCDLVYSGFPSKLKFENAFDCLIRLFKKQADHKSLGLQWDRTYQTSMQKKAISGCHRCLSY